MSLSEFGKVVRKARLDTGTNISMMAETLGVSAAFLSGVETGRKKIPSDLVQKIQDFFSGRGQPLEALRELADVSNKSVSLEGLPPQQQMLIAGFARTPMDPETLSNMEKLLLTAKETK